MKEEFEIEDQRKNEEIILVRYMHPWVLAKTGLIGIVIILFVVFSFLIWGASLVSDIVLITALLFIIIYGSIKIYLYKNSVFILTNQRVIYIDQPSLFRRKVHETELINIYNLQYEIKGIVSSFLNFGDIILTTQGDITNEIKILNIENPHFVHEKISNFRKKNMDQTRSSDNKPIIR